MATGTSFDTLINWPGAVGLLALGLVPELLPLLFGTGGRATSDWGFIYVTCHFVLLPLCSFVVLIASGVFLVRGPNRGRVVLPALIAAGFLLFLFLDPLPWLRHLYPHQ